MGFSGDGPSLKMLCWASGGESRSGFWPSSERISKSLSSGSDLSGSPSGNSLESRTSWASSRQVASGSKSGPDVGEGFGNCIAFLGLVRNPDRLSPIRGQLPSVGPIAYCFRVSVPGFLLSLQRGVVWTGIEPAFSSIFSFLKLRPGPGFFPGLELLRSGTLKPDLGSLPIFLWCLGRFSQTRRKSPGLGSRSIPNHQKRLLCSRLGVKYFRDSISIFFRCR